MKKGQVTYLDEQIRLYKQSFGEYESYAEILENYLNDACKVYLPHSIIQTRVKTISSFTEKAIRKKKQYPDPINQFGDLCGARIIVHTREQVEWVNAFIEKNFEVVEKEDVQKRLGDNQFGYLSIHYIVKLKPGHDYVKHEEDLDKIYKKKAEIQVKTILQHAWSDMLHDRTYKGKVDLPDDIRRNSAILAALLEEGDEKFSEVVDRTDNFFLNYSAYMTRDEIKSEIEILESILFYEAQPDEKPATALKLARLISLMAHLNEDDKNTPWEKELTAYKNIIKRLEPYENQVFVERPYLLIELGTAYCEAYKDDPGSEEYRKGQEFFNKVLDECNTENSCLVLDEDRLSSIKALAKTRLARSYEIMSGKRKKVRDLYFESLSYEPKNPYYLAESLGHKLSRGTDNDIPEEFKLLISEAIDICSQHIQAGVELPKAYFTKGRLSVLIEDYDSAYGHYARGLRHFMDKDHFSPAGTLGKEEDWLNLIAMPDENEKIDHIRTLFRLGDAVKGDEKAMEYLEERYPEKEIPEIKNSKNVLIVAGGASDMKDVDLAEVAKLLKNTLQNYEGLIISGGTTAGIPGLIGEVVAELKNAGNNIYLLGYIPTHLSSEDSVSDHYDKVIKCSDRTFSQEQLHRSWYDLLKAGVRPSDVKLLGMNGGRISAMEYRLAAALGATVGIIMGTGREADKLFSDKDWQGVSKLAFIPNEIATVSLFVSPGESPIPKESREELAKLAHEKYLSKRIKDHEDGSFKFWEDLPENMKDSNRLQVAYSIQCLQKAGFKVKEVANANPKAVLFSDEEVELMAELEHGRWNAERLLDGWRYGMLKNTRQKINPSLVSWYALPDHIRQYDRDAVREFPKLLAKIDYEIYRMEDQQKIISNTRGKLDSRFKFVK